MNIANKISMFRILSVPFFVSSLVYYSQDKDFFRFIALGIFLLAVASDAVDGYIARKAKQKSKAGLVLDPLADKVLLISAFICLYLINGLPRGIKLPLWVTLIVISRDAIILLGAVVIYFVRQSMEIYPTKWGKLTTAFQMSCVVGVLLQFKFTYILWWIAVFFTVISGVDYIRRGFKTLYALDNSRSSH